MTQWAVETSGLAKAYGGQRVLDGVDLQVPRGTVFALLGPNGAGKTTTVRLLATLAEPDGGRACVAGFDVVSRRHDVRRRISLTGQYAALDQQQTGAENLRLMGRLSGLSARAAARVAGELLARFDLDGAADRRVTTYSGGMRRRLDLAAGLVRRPEVLFLDEPTTGLDPRSRQAMWQVVAELAADGVTVFLTTQYLEEADRLADRIAVVDEGRVVADGTAAQLKARVTAERLDLTAADAAAYDGLAAQLGHRAVHHDRTTLTLGVATDGDARAVRRLLDEVDPTGDRVARFSVHSASLDDVFFTLTGRQAAPSGSEPTDVTPVSAA
jgi:ABC-2 type transport system ATP-binding protein